MRALILDANEIKKLQGALAFAENNPLTFDDLVAMKSGTKDAPGNGNYTCLIPVGFKVVITIDLHPEHGKLRHLSISVDEPGRAPSPEACNMIMQIVGFKSNLETCIHVFIEDCIGGRKAVNIVDLY